MEKNVLKVITDAMLEKKGQQVVSLDLSSIGTAISDYFVVCNADSTTAVAAIADNIIVRMEEKCGRKVLRMQGLENDFWIILDYGDIVVHVFLTQRVEYTDEPVVEQTVSEKRVKPKAASKVRASAKRVKNRDGE